MDSLKSSAAYKRIDTIPKLLDICGLYFLTS